MFLYPALTIGFLFVAMPLLVHLINMLRHRRQRWAAMDFLLASYRKQKKWIRLAAVAVVVVPIGGGRITDRNALRLDRRRPNAGDAGGTNNAPLADS